jgi:CBS domain-containing protein
MRPRPVPEIWRQTAGRVTHFRGGRGHRGTISGVGRYLKAQNPAVEVIAADPEGSIYSGGGGRPYLVEGIGEDFWPTTYDPAVVDRVVAVSDRGLVPHGAPGDHGGGDPGRRIDRHRGVGGPRDRPLARPRRRRGRPHPRLGPGVSLQALRRRLDDRPWVLAARGESVETVLASKGDRLPPLVHVHPDETVRVAIAILEEYGVSQVPVVKAEPPLALAEVVGSVTDRLLLERSLHHPEVFDQPVESVMAAAPGHGWKARRSIRWPTGCRCPRRWSCSTGAIPSGSSPDRISCRFWSGPDRWPDEGSGALGFETLAIHAGQPPDPSTGAVVTPIYQTSTYSQSSVGETHGYEYSRSGNPTRTALETCLAALEGATYGRAFSSGLAAEDAILRLLSPVTMCSSGTTCTAARTACFRRCMRGPACISPPSPSMNPSEVMAAWQPTTRMVWVETPSNPLLRIADIAVLAELAHARHASWWSTTPLPRRTCSVRSHWARTWSSTRRPSTWVGTATWSVDSSPPPMSRSPSGSPSCRTPSVRSRALRLLPRAAGREDVGGPDGPPLRQCRPGGPGAVLPTPPWTGCTTRACRAMAAMKRRGRR